MSVWKEEYPMSIMGKNTKYNSLPDGTCTGEAAACEITVLSRAFGVKPSGIINEWLGQNQGQFPGN